MSKKSRKPSPPPSSAPAKAPPAPRPPRAGRTPGDPAAPAPLSPAKRRVFTAITLAFPFLLLGLLELGLRLAGFGHSYPLFVDAPAEGYLLPNADVARRYFRQGTIAPVPQM